MEKRMPREGGKKNGKFLILALFTHDLYIIIFIGKSRKWKKRKETNKILTKDLIFLLENTKYSEVEIIEWHRQVRETEMKVTTSLSEGLWLTVRVECWTRPPWRGCTAHSCQREIQRHSLISSSGFLTLMGMEALTSRSVRQVEP